MKFIQNNKKQSKTNEKNRVALLSMIAASFLTTFKIIVAVMTGSIGILSEAIHSGLDLIAAVITWFAVRISAKPADKNHNFGHGKVENMSALIETILLLITCIWIIYEAIHRLLSGNTHIEVTFWSYTVVITSIIIDFTRSRALKRVAKKYNSQALEADALHFSTDIWSSMVVLTGLICSDFGIFSADSIAALAVALIVIYVSFSLGKKAVNVLLDKVPGDIYEKINNIMKGITEIECYHDLKIRVSGPDTFVNVNIHINPQLNISESHRIADEIEEKIQNEVPNCFIHVHQEPDEN
jgi:cation diffusion facilitator family transporter